MSRRPAPSFHCPSPPQGCSNGSCPTRLPGQVVSVKKKQSQEADFKHLQAPLTAPASQRTQTLQWRTQLPKIPSQGAQP